MTETTNPQNHVFQYLTAMDALITANTRRAGWSYSSEHGLILKHGRTFTPAPLPPELSLGEGGQCYLNSFRSTGADYAYVEGFALRSVLPVAHAWVTPLDGSGVALDLTWDPLGVAYFGVAFAPDWYQWWVSETSYPCVFNCEMAPDALVEIYKNGLPPEALL